MKYRAYGLILETQEHLAELEPISADASQSDVRLSIEPADAWPPPFPAKEAAADANDEDAWPLIQHDAAGYRLSFDEQAAFWVASDGRTIRCFPASSPAHTLNHFLLDHVLPRALHLMGRNPLHATAVATSSGAVAFLGKTGTGKSTVAAALGHRGASLVSDDCLLLHRDGELIIATPSYAGLRVYDDVRETLFPQAASNQVAHYSKKQRVTTAFPLATAPQALRAVFALERIPDLVAPTIERLRPADATMALAGAAFHMDMLEHRLQREQLRFCAEIARRVPLWRCTVPDDLARLPELATLVIRATAGQT